jgi:hypothetical protein
MGDVGSIQETDMMPTKSGRKRVSEKSRAELLAEIAALPPDAFITSTHAAAYIDSTPGVLHSWRSQRRGPRFHGSHEFVRYRISDLDRWMAARADEIPEIEKVCA